jgi:acetyl esterase/lipase
VIDLFFDEDRIYANQLKAAGVDSTLDIVPGAPHGFEVWGVKTKLAQAYVSRSREWLREKLAGEPAR